MAEKLDWRKLAVRRDAKFESLEEKFCSTKGARSGAALFDTVKELMVFAALVGHQLGSYQPLGSNVSATPILLDTYSTTGHDAYIYLLALSAEPSLDILKDENLRNAIRIFEGYCNGGLKYIDDWVMSNLGEPLISNILFNKTLEFLLEDE